MTEMCKTLVEEMTIKVTEDFENFVFDTISPYCNNVMRMKISKEDLKKAILQYYNKDGGTDK